MIDSTVKTIAIFRALQLGDMLCAIPAIRSLRKAHPSVHITLIGLPWAKELIPRFPNYFDDFIAFPGYPGLPEQNFNQTLFDTFLKRVQAHQFDMVLQMQGNGTIVNQLLQTFGARYVAGFSPTPQPLNPGLFFMPYPNHGHEINRHLELMAFLGIPSTGTDLEFPTTKQDEDDFHQLKLPVNNGRYIVIHPGSRGNWRQWPSLYFASLGDYCQKSGYQVVITGTKDEIPIINEVIKLMKYPPIVAAGKTTIGSVAVLIDHAYALIANCTGVSHLASALATQSVIISMDGETERWAPLDKNLHATIDWTKTTDYHAVLKEVTALFFRL
ncbi:ADP-heptose:LPS heptosyltransferase [Pedobacter sp. CAN_A7]|uniref:glycosyltransferase family 9 protein n=1 Tax=Pedobacter sp. CAN_A7 TaxID=2787722 RepID=UPI001A2F7F16